MSCAVGGVMAMMASWKSCARKRARAVRPRATGAAPTVACQPDETGADAAVVVGDSRPAPRPASRLSSRLAGGVGGDTAAGLLATLRVLLRPRGLGLRALTLLPRGLTVGGIAPSDRATLLGATRPHRGDERPDRQPALALAEA
jgi:hypothetical protein